MALHASREHLEAPFTLISQGSGLGALEAALGMPRTKCSKSSKVQLPELNEFCGSLGPEVQAQGASWAPSQLGVTGGYHSCLCVPAPALSMSREVKSLSGNWGPGLASISCIFAELLGAWILSLRSVSLSLEEGVGGRVDRPDPPTPDLRNQCGS